MKTFLYVLITNFVFSEADVKVVKANVYVAFVVFLAEGRVALTTLTVYSRGLMSHKNSRMEASVR